MFSSILRLWIFELRQLLRSGGEWAYPAWFTLIIASIFPLSLDPDPALLRQVGIGIIWSAAALGSLLLLPRLFEQDRADGTLEQYLVSAISPFEVAAAKLLAYWQLLGLGIGLACWPAALLYGYGLFETLWLCGIVVAGIGGMVAIGMMLSAMATATAQHKWLQVILALPLYIPLLIFGSASGAHILVDYELAVREALLLTGMVMLLVPLGTCVTAYLLRHGLED